MGKELTLNVQKEGREEPKIKRKRERIQLIETRPKKEWFVICRAGRGRQVIYLQFQITGLSTRFYGPFRSKRTALLFLDELLALTQEMLGEAAANCYNRVVEEEYHNISIPIVQYPILSQLLHARFMTN